MPPLYDYVGMPLLRLGSSSAQQKFKLDFYLLLNVFTGDYELSELEFHIVDINNDSRVDIFDLIICGKID